MSGLSLIFLTHLSYGETPWYRLLIMLDHNSLLSLFQMGVLDYSGGYVIHLSSGTAGFVAAAIVGPRSKEDRLDARPSNVMLMMTGAGILWIGERSWLS